MLCTQSDISICLIVTWSVQLKYVGKLSELIAFLTVIAGDKRAFPRPAVTNASLATVGEGERRLKFLWLQFRSLEIM